MLQRMLFMPLSYLGTTRTRSFKTVKIGRFVFLFFFFLSFFWSLAMHSTLTVMTLSTKIISFWSTHLCNSSYILFMSARDSLNWSTIIKQSPKIAESLLLLNTTRCRAHSQTLKFRQGENVWTLNGEDCHSLKDSLIKKISINFVHTYKLHVTVS